MSQVPVAATDTIDGRPQLFVYGGQFVAFVTFSDNRDYIVAMPIVTDNWMLTDEVNIKITALMWCSQDQRRSNGNR